jgi:hypothetical protein
MMKCCESNRNAPLDCCRAWLFGFVSLKTSGMGWLLKDSPNNGHLKRPRPNTSVMCHCRWLFWTILFVGLVPYFHCTHGEKSERRSSDGHYKNFDANDQNFARHSGEPSRKPPTSNLWQCIIDGAVAFISNWLLRDMPSSEWMKQRPKSWDSCSATREHNVLISQVIFSKWKCCDPVIYMLNSSDFVSQFHQTSSNQYLQ